MAEAPRRMPGGSPRLTPEEIASRGFASAFRGVSETDVRNYLKRVADEVAIARERELELMDQVSELRSLLASPPPVTEQALLDSLGEETARVLRSAQDAAEEIRSRAEERAGVVVRESQEAAASLREATEGATRESTEAAERISTERIEAAEAESVLLVETAAGQVAEMLATSEAAAQETREVAEIEAATEVEASKDLGRSLLNEARVVRERVLADLGRRRTLLQAQVDELRAGRDRLLDGYRVVKRTLSEATEALVAVEARAAAALAAPPEPSDVPPVEGELEALEGNQVSLDGSVRASVDDEASGAVEALFARLKAEASESKVDKAETVETVKPDAPGEFKASELESSKQAEKPAVIIEEEVVEAEDLQPGVAGESADPDDLIRTERRSVLDPLAKDLASKAKRSLQDEQNDLLDRIRKAKGAPKAVDLLPSDDDQHRSWSNVLQGPLTSAYAGGYALGAGSKTRKQVPASILNDLAADIVVRLRRQLVTAIDDAPDADAIVARLGARYREFKAQELEDVIGDALAAVWAKGTFDSTPSGTGLRWVPEVVGRCPDCDDNGLETTLIGQSFPTGALLPPAHQGCRCLLVPAIT